MSDRSSRKSSSSLGQLVSQAIATIHAKFNPQALVLKPGARVPELRVRQGEGARKQVYPLISDRYLLGRSSKTCDIVVRNPLVSQVHLSLNRTRNRHFRLDDEGSTNGVYLGKRRRRSFPLRHGDKITLGPPEMADAVQVEFYDPPSPMVRGLRYGGYGVGGILGLLALWVGVEWTRFSVRPLPESVQGPIVVYSADGQPLRPLPQGTHRELAELSDFSPYLPEAAIASEDSRYYWHLGIDPIGILRATLVNLQAGGARQGASTITQQLARSLYTDYVGRDNSVGRKLREMVVALKLETFLSKDEILLNYLNRVYLGSGKYGFENAAQFYFGKSAADLTISQAATLVAILPAPNRYNPVQDYETALQLRNRVIERMVEQGSITPEEGRRARRSRIEVTPRAREVLRGAIAPYFYDYVLVELRQLLGSELAGEGNFIVETRLDLSLQNQAQAALKQTVAQQSTIGQGAILTVDTQDGAILAMVGGTDYQQTQFNRAFQARRQPGSTFKVFAYAAALAQNISPGKQYSCGAIAWMGQRYRGCDRSSGSINMYRALAQSENAVALRIARDVGLRNTIAMARRLGVNSSLTASPGLVLGESEVTLLEMTGAYATFANQGEWNRPHAIVRILDASDCEDEQNLDTCRVIYAFENSSNADIQVISSGVAETMTSLMRGVVRGGTGTSANIGYGEAGKTGTSDEGVDLWFIGYVPSRQLATGVWLGNDNNEPTYRSSAIAARLWGEYMGEALR